MHDLTAHEHRAIRRHAELLRRLDAAAPAIYIVGANEGQTGRAYLEALPQGEIWAFEPSPELAHDLAVTADPRLHVVPLAIGAYQGRVELELRADNRVSSILAVEPQLAQRSSHYDTRGVVDSPIDTLDELISRDGGLPIPQLLSTDTQGYDLEVLRGASRVLATGEVFIVTSGIYFASAYIGQAQAHEVMAHLAGFGYRLHGFDRLVEATSGTLYFGNAIFLSPTAWQRLGLL